MAFGHIICGIDGSAQSLAAAAQAARLAEPGAEIVLTACNEPEMTTPRREALAAAEGVISPGHVVRSIEQPGVASEELVEAARAAGADLIAVGSFGIGRLAGILIGSVATTVLHNAPCSVLVARVAQADPWPRTIVVGVDGSDVSARAFEIGTSIATHLEVPLRPLISIYGESGYELQAARALAPDLEEREAGAVDALVGAASSSDLIVVGSRGLRGVRALGSVSERVAHESDASVLVVRES